MQVWKAIAIVILVCLCPPFAHSIANPAAKDCIEAGNDYQVKTDENNNQYGVCIISGQEKEEWEYYKEKVAKNAKKEMMQSVENSDDGFMKSADKGNKLNITPRDTNSMQDTAKMQQRNRIADSEGKGLSALPNSFDWRDYQGKNWLTSVKNQGNCGSCWLFSSVSALESAVKIDLNEPNYNIDLSEQEVLSCSPYNTIGCYGGWEWQALNYAKNYGITDEAFFSYMARDDISCNERDESCYFKYLYYIRDYTKLPPSFEEIKRNIVENGPVTAYMYADWDFMDYRGGIYRHNEPLWWGGWHSILIVGYNDDERYWICKNSWGEYWGEKGYFRISYDENVTNYREWRNNLSDNRVFFLDDSYAITETDSDADDDDIANEYDTTANLDFDVIEPKEGEILSERIVPLMISSNLLLNRITLKDMTNPKFRESTLCSDCNEFGYSKKKTKSFDDGNHTLSIKGYSCKDTVEHEINITVDSTKPKISSFLPANKYANGSFRIEYKEKNPVNITLYYNNINIKNEDCGPSAGNGVSACEFYADLSSINGNNIIYYFEITDIAGNLERSRTIEAKVDTKKPEIIKKEYNPLTKKFNIMISENVNLKYYDENENAPAWKTLCNECNSSSLYRPFAKGTHKLILNAADKAGNIEISRMNPFPVN
jgi:C1A family cysteine protease